MLRGSVRGYNVYKDMRAAAIGEELMCDKEATNYSSKLNLNISYPMDNHLMKFSSNY